ncbi:MAG: PLD nuclease N-terminal domain-containing protein [Peptococcaceae bacterium]|nr:PLD nuclease N-terminal domain-containing protein [Peptococcaceae bacterium]
MGGYDLGVLNESMELIWQMMPLIIILSLLQTALMIAALVHLIRNGQPKYMNKAVWAIIIILFSPISPVLYFILGRNEDGGDDDGNDDDG